MAKKTLLDNIIESIKGIDGQLIKQSGTTEQMISDLNYKVVAPAKSAADSAASAADAAVASAQSDVSKAFTQIADTANALSDTKTAFNSDVAEAKQLANTAQSTADNAIKSAASVASDLTAVASQAKSNASGITKVTSDVGLLQTTVADNSGNISKIQETATKIQQAVSDNSGNITTAKQTADSAVAVASDAKSNATVAVQTASGASVTAKDAQGDATTAITTANSAVTQASDAKSNATIAVQTASEASVTATNAQGDASIAKQTASEATVQASNAESDFAQLSIRANKIEANVATNSGAIASVQQTADGIKSTVATKADQSTVTQLSNLIQDKVSSGDFTSTTTQLKNLINQRVQVGDVISQINQEAGGNTLIQVSNGNGSLILNAGNTIITGNAWIPSAAIESLDASKLTFYGANNTYATMGASVAQYDDDNQKSTINLQYNGGIEIHSSNQQGSILTMHDNTIRLASKSWGDNSNPYQYSGFYAAPNYSLMNTYHKDGTTSGVAIDDNQIHIYGSSKDQQLGSLQADVGWYSINGQTGLLTGNQISLKAGNTQAVLTDNNININNTSDTNDKNYDVAIHIKGWAEMTGWFTCMGMTQTSLLSTKTRIEPLDTKVALDKIVSANVETYQFKTDVANGKTKRHASVILDDVNDVAEYYTPEEFISENRMGRDDGDIIGYLMGAVQELKKQLDELKEKI